MHEEVTPELSQEGAGTVSPANTAPGSQSPAGRVPTLQEWKDIGFPEADYPPAWLPKPPEPEPSPEPERSPRSMRGLGKPF